MDISLDNAMANIGNIYYRSFELNSTDRRIISQSRNDFVTIVGYMRGASFAEEHNDRESRIGQRANHKYHNNMYEAYYKYKNKYFKEQNPENH